MHAPVHVAYFYVRSYVYVYVCMYIYVRICVCVYIYMYIYTYIQGIRFRPGPSNTLRVRPSPARPLIDQGGAFLLARPEGMCGCITGIAVCG